MRLSEVYGHGEYERDAEFETLGQSDSACRGTLAYCDSIYHLKRADKNPNVNCLISTSELVAVANNTEGLIACDDPRQRFFQLHRLLVRNQLLEPEMEYGIGNNCNIHPTACISKRARIGDNVDIGAHVVVHDHVDIGSDTFIDSGVQIGVEGLLYWTASSGDRFHVRHQGGVRVGQHCALLSNTVIVRSVHRGLLTTIGHNCVIGIAANIGHEVQLGCNVIVSNHCVVARAACIENHSHIGTSSVIREYVEIGNHAQVKPGSIVVDNVAAGQAVSGNYAVSHGSHLREYLQARKQCKVDLY
jgi:acyl-[acyl carrier protein]--UDP-N-acetylglucosamine O-acyltransferase